jgi:two-component system, LuxR family, response regulator FixJ
MPESKIIHLVDDDEAIRHSASFMLRQSGMTVSTYADGKEFLDSLARLPKGCVLLDVRMPNVDGLTVLREMKSQSAAFPVIVLTGHGDVSMAVEAMKAGAVDFVEKPYEKASLLAAIERAFARFDDQSDRATRAMLAREKIARLTAREKDVLALLVRGMTNKAIADELDISARTVEIHRAHVMEKLEADSLSSALRLAFAAEADFAAD